MFVVVTFTCEESEYLCGEGECIGRAQLCDGVPQCTDSADEQTTLCESCKYVRFTTPCDSCESDSWLYETAVCQIHDSMRQL